MSERELPIADALEQAAAHMAELIRTVHERVACPKCGCGIGVRCQSLTRRSAPTLKHSHKERLRADGINLR